jgi:hypothetical protein
MLGIREGEINLEGRRGPTLRLSRRKECTMKGFFEFVVLLVDY